MKKGPDDSQKYKKVLLIDESEIDNFINERIISTSNFAEDIVIKDSAQGALNYLKECISTNTALPEIIFLDLNMPIMDGFAFLDAFDKLAKEHGNIKDDCKIIVLSSSISQDDIDKASTNPYVYKYVNKPLNQRYLEAINY